MSNPFFETIVNVLDRLKKLKINVIGLNIFNNN